MRRRLGVGLTAGVVGFVVVRAVEKQPTCLAAEADGDVLGEGDKDGENVGQFVGCSGGLVGGGRRGVAVFTF